jgi:hypothetical protein
MEFLIFLYVCLDNLLAGTDAGLFIRIGSKAGNATIRAGQNEKYFFFTLQKK